MDIDQTLIQAENLHRNGKLSEARAVYQAVLTRDPEQADALYGIGTVLMQQKHYRQAGDYLQKAVSILPDIPEFLFNLALVEEITGARDKAGKTCLHAARCARNDIDFLIRICQKLIDLGRAQQALSCLTATGKETAQIRWSKVRAHGAMGSWGEALKILTTLTGQFPDDAALWREQSRAAGHIRNYDAAIRAYQTYMAKKQPDGQDFLGLADLYLMARRPGDARDILQKSFEAGLDDAEAYLIAGKCARLAGEYPAARENLEKAIARRPVFGQAWQLLFEILDISELAALADQCAALEKDDRCRDKDRITLALAAGQAFDKTGRHNDAFQAFTRANQAQKTLMAQQGIQYQPAETDAEIKKITDCYPKEGDYNFPKVSSPVRPVFILGMPRTGTTLVEKILGQLAGVDTGGENEAMEHIARQYYHQMRQENKPSPGELTTGELAEMAAAYWQRTSCNGSVITDKMPHNFRHIGLICQIFPKAPIIYMTRDPRDVCLSIYCRHFPDVHSYAVDLRQLAHFYACSERLKAHWKALFPDRILEVVYEDLIDNPDEKTREIAAFCGLDWQPECLDFHKMPGTSFTFSELQVRRPVNRDGIGRWHHYEKQLQPLTDALEKYGVLENNQP